MKALLIVIVFVLTMILANTSGSLASQTLGQKNETIQGKVDSVSPDKGEVTIAAADRRVTVSVTADTQIRVNEKVGKLADVRAGVTATVVFTTKEGRHTAKSIRVEALFQ
jgi:hypothetical protein